MRSVSYQGKVCHWFFPEFLAEYKEIGLKGGGDLQWYNIPVIYHLYTLIGSKYYGEQTGVCDYTVSLPLYVKTRK
jgi:hypothetical protein